MEAVEKEVAAQRKIGECLKNRAPGHEMVTRLMEAIFERQVAASETFKAALADMVASRCRLLSEIRDVESSGNEPSPSS
jgi:hypothetical protein